MEIQAVTGMNDVLPEQMAAWQHVLSTVGELMSAYGYRELLVPIVEHTQLTLRFTADSWTEVYDATGKQVFADVGSQGTVHTFKGKAPFKVNLGNGPGVGVEVNGHRAVIDAAVRSDGKASFVVLKDGRIVKRNGG